MLDAHVLDEYVLDGNGLMLMMHTDGNGLMLMMDTADADTLCPMACVVWWTEARQFA